MRRRHEVHTAAGDRAIVADIDLEWKQIALPADDIHGVERIEHGAVLVVALDLDGPLSSRSLRNWLLACARRWYKQERRIKGRVTPNRSDGGQFDFPHRFDHEEIIARLIGHDSKGHTLGYDDIVSGLVGNRSELGIEYAGALVNEMHLITIGIARAERHRVAATTDPNGNIVVVEQTQR